MIKRFASLLRRIGGRLKEYMLAGALTLSFMLVPLGYYFMIEGPNTQAQLAGQFTVLAGIILFIVVLLKSVQVEKRNNEQSKKMHEELIDILRQERNERSEKSK